MSVMSAIALARREHVQGKLAQEMKRLQGRANFRRRVRERLERRSFSAALDAAVQGEESLRQKRWDDAIANLDALDSGSAPAAQLEAARREEMAAYDSWYEFNSPSKRHEFVIRFKLAYER
jgi:hypothetical protein